MSNTKTIQSLEDELKQKQIQIKSLLTITQAINENVSAQGLFDMYKSFLSWDMEIDKMALFFNNQEQSWSCVTTINYQAPENVDYIIANIEPHKRQHVVSEDAIEELKEFDIIIPVLHKDQKIAYAFIGGIDTHEDIYNKTQFITTITNMITVAIENKRLFKRQLQQAQYEKELELANSVQQMLIPQRLPKKKKINISQIYMPHSDVGGDYLDVIRLNRNRSALCIGDISGKGVAAAILMANFQAKIQASIRQYHDLESFIVDLNTSVYNITKSDKFITFFVAVVDTEQKRISYINCGHYPPVILVDGQIKEMDKGTTFLGAFKELPKIEKGIISFEDEAFMFLFTDGLSDLLDNNGRYFDTEMITEFMYKHQQDSPDDFNAHLLKHIDSFKGAQTYTDDIAILTCKLN